MVEAVRKIIETFSIPVNDFKTLTEVMKSDGHWYDFLDLSNRSQKEKSYTDGNNRENLHRIYLNEISNDDCRNWMKLIMTYNKVEQPAMRILSR